MWLYLTGCDQLPTAKSTPIVKECFCPEFPKDFSSMRRFGMISELSTEEFSQNLSTYCTGDFLAKIYLLQVLGLVWQENEADFSSRSCAWPKKSSPLGYSLKMCQQSHTGADFESLEKLPKWGMTVDGVLYPLRPLERYTNGKDGSYWPTPQTRDHKDGSSQGNRKSPNLGTAVKMYPTPDASPRGARKNQNGHTINLQDVVGSGKLNPEWVEWLMGYPKGWTELSAWATRWLVSKRKKRSKS